LKVKHVCNIKIYKNLFPLRIFHAPSELLRGLTENQAKIVFEFNRKTENGFIELESVPCLCGYKRFDLIASLDRYLMIQQTVICTNCGLIQSNPRMTSEQYKDFYSSDVYRKCYSGEDFISRYKSKYNSNESLHIFDEINKIKTIDSDVSVLEFGAGGGRNLVPFIEAGAKVVGIDYSPNLVKLGREHGINMMQGSIDEIVGIYDVIIMNHVLEHLLSPVESLEKIKKHLKEDGIFYIAVPNIMNFSIGQLQNAHAYYFNPETFQYYCFKAGLSMVKKGVSEGIHMFGIFKALEVADENMLIDDYLKNNYKKMLQHLRKIKIKEYAKLLLAVLHLKKITKAIYSRVFHA